MEVLAQGFFPETAGGWVLLAVGFVTIVSIIGGALIAVYTRLVDVRIEAGISRAVDKGVVASGAEQRLMKADLNNGVVQEVATLRTAIVDLTQHVFWIRGRLGGEVPDAPEIPNPEGS